MDKETILTTFNQHFSDFIKDVQNVFPENVDIATARKAINQVVAVMPRLLIKLFRDNFVEKYQAAITLGNLDFFTEMDYSADLQGVEDSNELMKKIDCLRRPVKEMSPTNQAKVVKYMQNLAKLSEMYRAL
jgi:hypothetical protein